MRDVPRTRPTWLFWAGIGAAAALVIGGFGPWVTVLGESANGTEVEDGWLTIGCGCLVAALLLVAYVRRNPAGSASISWGLALAAAGAIAALAIGVGALIGRPASLPVRA
jgi:hypothetical protein